METCKVGVNSNYFVELQEKFTDVLFERIERVEGLYITNPELKSMYNDLKIFIETQVKRILRYICAPVLPKVIKEKLSYFSQEEDKDPTRIYKFANEQNLQSGEKYVLQNVGHATQLIQIPGFNILTDPIFNCLHSVLYPSKTDSHPDIEQLPQIDVLLISHNHRDHVDKDSLQKLLEYCNKRHWSQPMVFVPMGDKNLFENFGFDQIEEVEWYTKLSVTKDVNGKKRTVSFISTPVDHRSGRTFTDHHTSLITGWIINPQQDDVIVKFAGDTRALTDEYQLAVDAVLWNEIKNKDKSIEDMDIPDIICLEPSGPNYTRCDLGVTHQSTSYSVLLKFVEASNLAKLSGKSSREFLQKIQTVMMHHNKFELGPDRFNEGLFVFKKLVKYLHLNEDDLNKELERQKEKLERNFDREALKKNTSFALRFIISVLPEQTSLLVHAKDFIIKEIIEMIEKLEAAETRDYFIEYLVKNTIFPKIGERLNNEEVVNSRFDLESVHKYNGKF